ncbi:calcium-binding protein [Kribbella albertanoniae]|nr:calcium-binding protein [Kribbella albertanoniae]
MTRNARRFKLSTVVVGVLIALAVHSPAAGVTTPIKVTLEDGVLRVLGGPQDDHPTIYVTAFPADRPPRVVVDELGRDFVTSAPCVTVGTSSRVECPLKAVTEVIVETGDGNDSINHRTDFPARLVAGSGSDTVNGSASPEWIDLGPGDDVAQVLGGTDDVVGGPGNDRVTYGAIADLEIRLDDLANDGAAGENSNIHSDVENLTGGQGSDLLVGSAAPNRMDGGPGNDKLLALDGDDILIGDAGADVMSGGPGIDAAHYMLRYTPLSLSIDNVANDGAPGEKDDIRADVENLLGGVAADTLIGSDSANDLDGSSGDDLIEGRGGDDVLRGGAGNDILIGDAGFDTGLGDAGTDTCKVEKQSGCP